MEASYIYARVEEAAPQGGTAVVVAGAQ